MITITLESPWQPDAIEMLEKSCAYIRRLYPADHSHTFKLAELTRSTFFLVRQEQRAVGCGASVHHAQHVIELKHIFLDPVVRGLGVGKALLNHLEQAAHGVQRIVLETGTAQPVAYGLYKACGYHDCPPFIAHPLPHAIFMEKFLSSTI